MIYSTRYIKRREGRVEKALGRAQLMSHPKRDSDDYHQARGWLDTNRQPWSGRDIPTPLRLPEIGTGIFILGWNPPGSDWPEQVALRAAQNFFAAIHHQQLQVNGGSGSATAPASTGINPRPPPPPPNRYQADIRKGIPKAIGTGTGMAGNTATAPASVPAWRHTRPPPAGISGTNGPAVLASRHTPQTRRSASWTATPAKPPHNRLSKKRLRWTCTSY